MWRLWTRGWGPRDWWRWVKREGFAIWVAKRLPHQVALWAFIIVYTNGCDSPGPDYKPVYDAWEAKRKR